MRRLRLAVNLYHSALLRERGDLHLLGFEEYGDQRIHDAAYACHLMTRTASDYPDVTILPPETFFPWNHDEAPDPSRITDKTLAAHHWSGSWIEKA